MNLTPFLANAETVLGLARQRVGERQGLRRVILSLEASPDLDSTALEALADFAAWTGAHGITLSLARLKDDVRALLLLAALPELPEQALSYLSSAAWLFCFLRNNSGRSLRQMRSACEGVWWPRARCGKWSL